MIPFRGAALRGRFYTREVNGRLIVSRWPRSQKTARTAREADNRQLMALRSSITKYMSAQEQQFSREIAAATKLSARDLMMISQYGRLGVVVFRDGRKIYSVAAIQDVSAIFDSIGQTPGDMFLRGETWWEVIAKGDPNQVLQIQPDGSIQWADLISSGVGLEAFQMPHLTPTLTTGLFGTGAFAARSTWLPAGTVVHGVRVGVKSFTGAHSMRGAIYAADPVNLDMGGGALVKESPSIAMALGIVSMPFTSVYTVPTDGWYWFGVGVTGANNPNFMAGDYVRPNEFFAGISFPLPATAPATTASSSVNSFWWLY
jgi:hypothetical protein